MDSTTNGIFTREVELESCSKKLTLYQQSIGEVNCVVWDAALVLVKYLDKASRNDPWLKGKKILELGAGVGCVGISAACLGANVLLTELNSAIPLLKTNVEANRTQWMSANGMARVQALEWGKDISLDFQPDLILMADCIYYEESIGPLLKTIKTLCNSNRKMYVIMSQEERDTPKQIQVWQKFLTELYKSFKVIEIPLSAQHELFSSPDIHLMKLLLL